jgi:hybrid cluster-associated redox disulfide protein
MKRIKRSKSRITEKSHIMESLEKHPEIAPVLLGYGLHCVGCSFSRFDTIETGAKIHGMSRQDLKMMLKDVNAVVSLEIKAR